MKTLIVLIAVLGVGYLGWTVWERTQRRAHDPIEYYAGWDGYNLPIRLVHRISKAEAEAMAAQGSPYMIGYFDGEGRLTRDIKMLQGAVFFEHLYEYHANGKLSRVTVTNADGVVRVHAYPDGARPTFFW